MKPLSQDSNYQGKDRSAPVLSHACPRCGHNKSWGSALRPTDGLLRILLYKPHRCRACMSRFWTLHSTFRLNMFIASGILLVGLLSVYVGSILRQPPVQQIAELSDDSKMQRRAKEGDADAALQLGMNFIEGSSKRDYKAAAKWLEQAARKNNTEAQYYYGLSLLNGKGVIQDYKAAVYWVDKAARKGYADAQLSLGKMYRRGKGVEVDRARAYLWFNLAAAQGNQEAARNRDSIVNHMELTDIIAMQEEAYRIDTTENGATKLSENTLTDTSSETAIQQ
jgi:uncharacterized protein